MNLNELSIDVRKKLQVITSSSLERWHQVFDLILTFTVSSTLLCLPAELICSYYLNLVCIFKLQPTLLDGSASWLKLVSGDVQKVFGCYGPDSVLFTTYVQSACPVHGYRPGSPDFGLHADVRADQNVT